MTFYRHLREAFDGHYVWQVCDACYEEIGPDDPVYIEADGDVDDEGRSYDCSRYECPACHGEAA